MVHIYLPYTYSSAADMVNLLGTHLDEMQMVGASTASADIANTMIVGASTNTRTSTYLDDEPIAFGTYITSTHLENTPNPHIITLPTFSPAKYGLTLLASR